ncbi:MAG: aldehyde dehydrogenase family protein [Sutterellaceae bacterium]|nr:aldehyde dehydrogenase family protein [Sutterellaceae bacterium]MDD7442230.1 aldehyde dehydrogenase family protein [Sutterellaceae bacterium]MDY2868603.1 aldehyde dehydrogenase family protein [Mesosutterella sp.]
MDFEKLYIGGKWVPSASSSWIEVENPADQTVVARVPAGNAADVDRAAKAAAAALPAWRATPLAERIALMERFLTEFRAREEELVRLVREELGSPEGFTRKSQVEYQYVRTRNYIDLAPSVPLVEKMAASTVYREPVGVVACITPWNYPLGQVIQKIVPALLMGNTVILKPSQHTPLSAYSLAEAIDAAGFPAGTFNLVTGRGSELGASLSTHPLVDMVSFTGSTKGGIAVSKSALESVKRVSLELGGKSPYVMLPGIRDYSVPIHILFNSILLNSGQTCTAFSRLLVPESEAEAIEREMLRIVPEYRVGDPKDPASKLGPMASRAQFEKVRSYISLGLEEGARLLTGSVPEEGRGYYVEPAIFTGVSNSMRIAREEIFGPVLCVITYKDIDEAVRIANDTTYGLNAGVFGEKALATEVAKRIEAGNVYINTSPRDTSAPFGGWKQSGIGREGGVYGMIEFTEQKALFDTGD